MARDKTIAVVTYPRISNLDEFQALRNVPGVRLAWARSPADVAHADWIILPGSKHTSGDLAWLRAQGLDRAIAQHAQRGGAVLGICGGLQMLGEALIDPQGIEQGNVLGSYLHGLFEDEGVLHALFGARAPTLESVFDGLADFIDVHFGAGVIADLIRMP